MKTFIFVFGRSFCFNVILPIWLFLIKSYNDGTLEKYKEIYEEMEGEING